MNSRANSSQVSLIQVVEPGSAFSDASDSQGNNFRTVSSSDDMRSAHEQSTAVAFVKGTKRKRLSKACDACHKSKRRCDGTAPCSNCYFASKTCTYTDSSGRPVPAPRNMNPERPLGPLVDVPTSDRALQQGDSSPPVPAPSAATQQERVAAKKKSRADRADPSLLSAVSSSSQHSQTTEQVSQPQSKLLDPETTHELVNLFFAHCNPHRLIFHKPSFSAALSRNRLPEYLILAVCAVAAPLSKTISARASLARVAGVPFYNEAVTIMFDNAGRLLSEPSLATAQALCLMEMHEVAASHSWTKHYKYFDLALRVMEESLEVHKPDDQVEHAASPDSLDVPMRPRSVQMMATIRLPIDETTFELAVHWSSATREYLHVPAPRTRYASQFGHVCRILFIYEKVQAVVAMNDGPARTTALRDCRHTLNAWIESLPAHLQFSEENVEKQTDMFETSSNTGAWCFCFMHALYPCCYLALLEGEGILGEPIPWVRDQLGTIFKATGTRAKNTILSACVLWSYSKYHPDDQQLHIWDRDFEKVWGFRVTVVAHQWREAQALERAQVAASASANPQQRDNVSGVSQPAPSAASESASQAGRQPGDVGTQVHGDQRVGHRFDGPPKAQQYQRAVFTSDAEQIVQAPLLRAPREIATNLPSLKASGLLDSWKPPSEAFASSLSISQPLPREDERRG